MFDMTAIGAAVENAVIAAAKHGQSSDVIWSPNANFKVGSDDPIAEIRLGPNGAADPLYSAIEARCTCRKMFSAVPLESDILRQLRASCECFPEVQVTWLTQREEKKQFGKLIAATDALRFQHRPFHEELFHQLRFRKTEVESTCDGLDVRTLELPWGLTSMLRLLRSWNVMRMVHNLRLTSLLTIPSAISVQKSGAIAIVSVPTSTAEHFFIGGRAIERLWLAGTNLGLSMHPLGSLPIFLLQPDPPPAFQNVIEKVRRSVHSLMPGMGERVIQLGLRVGFSSPPSERSRRRNPNEVILK